MSVWDPWSVDTGWYWQLYDKGAGGSANLFGIFSGRASEAIGAAGSGVGIYTAPGRITGIRMEANRRTPDARIFPHVRFCWGIFVGVQGKDLADPLQVQNINRQMNLHAGINLNKVYRYPVNADIASAARPLYMSAEAVQKIASSVRTDKVRADYFYNAESTARGLPSPSGVSQQLAIARMWSIPLRRLPARCSTLWSTAPKHLLIPLPLLGTVVSK